MGVVIIRLFHACSFAHESLFKCRKPRFLLWEEVVPQEAWDYEDKPSDVGLEVKALSG